MAIDTQLKRMSAMGLPPLPDGSITALDRRQIAGLYRMATAVPPIDFEDARIRFGSSWRARFALSWGSRFGSGWRARL